MYTYFAAHAVFLNMPSKEYRPAWRRYGAEIKHGRLDSAFP
jgi:hypothetical protein